MSHLSCFSSLINHCQNNMVSSVGNKNSEKRRSLSLCKRHHSEFMCSSDNSGEVVNAISHFNQQQQSPKSSVKRRSLFYCCSRRRSSSSTHARKRGSSGLEQQGTRVHIKQETQENLLMQQQQQVINKK